MKGSSLVEGKITLKERESHTLREVKVFNTNISIHRGRLSVFERESHI